MRLFLFICLSVAVALHSVLGADSGVSAATSSPGSPIWQIPKHISADRSDDEWFRDDLANTESLTSLVHRDGSQKREEFEPGIVGLVSRGIYLLLLFSPVFWTSGIAAFSTYFRNAVWYKLLCWAIESSGAAFIKWGQWASTRPDMFPAELCHALSRLHADAPLHSYQYTEERVKTELGSKIAEIFSEFDEKPIASGSIAQVYRAVLNGETVAVKVRHPNVREHIVKDFIVMKWVANFAEKVLGMQWLNLSESLSQFSGTIASQTRLDVEGWHLYLFNRNFRKWRDVSFPRPIVVTESVLVESFEHGETVSKYAKIMPKAVRKAKDRMVRINGGAPSSPSPEMFAEGSVARLELAHFIVCRGEDIYLKMLLEDNLMHADMHPGNILVAASDDVDKVSHNLVLVDAGMVAQLTRGERHNFIGLLSAVGEGGTRGGKEAAKFILNFSPSSDYSEATRDAFAVDMTTYFDTSCGGYGAETDLGEVLRGILGLCRKHQISVAANYATLIMNALCLDGMAGSLLPSYNILDGAKTFLRFHRFCANKGCSPLARYVVPAATRIKRITDRRFLKREKEQT